MDSPTATLIQMLRERVNSLVDDGNFDEAVHAATAAVEKAQQSLSTDLRSVEQFVDALELRGELYRALGRFEEARDDYKTALDQLEERPDRLLQVGRLCADQGAVHDALGNRDRASYYWQRAMDIFENAEPPSPLDVAAMANNLAYLKKDAGDVDGAETHFLKALEILHRELGPNHEETAVVSNNIGALYLASGYYEQAREMHMMALDSRRKNLGEDHPDTAQSRNNLALALLETGDRSWARRHFERALETFESLGSDYQHDLEAVASNYCEFLRAEGEEALAEKTEQRILARASS